MSHWLLLPLLMPLAAGIVNIALVHRAPGPQRAVTLAATLGLLPTAILLLLQADTGAYSVALLGDWPAPFGIVLVLDRLSALMLVLTATVALPALLHAFQGSDCQGPGFHVFFPLQLFGINGAFLTGDLFNLFVFFEILLIASYALALHGLGAQRVRAGLHYAVLNLIGSGLLLLAIGSLYAILGTLNMADLAAGVAVSTPENGTLLRIGALLLLVVFGLKAALLPLNLWLPGVYTHSTAPVAALFAIMTKVGIYSILRIFTLIFPEQDPAYASIGAVLMPLALLTLALGAAAQLGSGRLRLLVAFQVIASTGTLLAGISQFNGAGLTASLYYLPHTTLATAGLFLLSDLIAADRGEQGDRFTAGPPFARFGLLGGLFLLGAVAAAGLPPLSGFIGKVLLLRSIPPQEAGWLWTTVLLAGLAGLAAFSRAGIALFWSVDGDRPSAPGKLRRHFAPAALLLAMTLAMTVFAAPVTRYAQATAGQLLDPRAYISAVLVPERAP